MRVLPLLLLAGCSTLVGYGTPVATQPVQSGSATQLSFSDPGTGPHQLWLGYGRTPTEFSVSAGPVTVSAKTTRHLTGTVVLRQGGVIVRTDQLSFEHDEAPLVGQKIHKELRLSSGHQTWLYEIPASPAGTTVEVEVSGVQIPSGLHHVEMTVTD